MWTVVGKIKSISATKNGKSKRGSIWMTREILIKYKDKDFGVERVMILNLTNKFAKLKVGDLVKIQFYSDAVPFGESYLNRLNIEEIVVIDDKFTRKMAASELQASAGYGKSSTPRQIQPKQ